ncbi:hypothetical protein BD414DRAFT_472634 [Trametes punicea]|nr:hypothetical protein BD414DRAFT_472634 [Trametes punicea]
MREFERLTAGRCPKGMRLAQSGAPMWRLLLSHCFCKCHASDAPDGHSGYSVRAPATACLSGSTKTTLLARNTLANMSNVPNAQRPTSNVPARARCGRTEEPSVHGVTGVGRATIAATTAGVHSRGRAAGTKPMGHG